MLCEQRLVGGDDVLAGFRARLHGRLAPPFFAPINSTNTSIDGRWRASPGSSNQMLTLEGDAALLGARARRDSRTSMPAGIARRRLAVLAS